MGLCLEAEGNPSRMLKPLKWLYQGEIDPYCCKSCYNLEQTVTLGSMGGCMHPSYSVFTCSW